MINPFQELCESCFGGSSLGEFVEFPFVSAGLRLRWSVQRGHISGSGGAKFKFPTAPHESFDPEQVTSPWQAPDPGVVVRANVVTSVGCPHQDKAPLCRKCRCQHEVPGGAGRWRWLQKGHDSVSHQPRQLFTFKTASRCCIRGCHLSLWEDLALPHTCCCTASISMNPAPALCGVTLESHLSAAGQGHRIVQPGQV